MCLIHGGNSGWRAYERVAYNKTRANTGHAVLRSTLIPPKMRRRNGQTDRRTDRPMDRQTNGQTDGPTLLKRCFLALKKNENNMKAEGASLFPLFLGAAKHLYKRVCPSVRPSVGRSVGRSVTPSHFRRFRRASEHRVASIGSYLWPK